MTSALDLHEYARAVGERVAAAVERTYGERGDTVALPPLEQVADRISDLVIDVDPGNELVDLLAPFWSAEKTRAALGGPSRTRMSQRRKEGSLLGLKTSDRVIVYPVSQFEPHGGGVRVRPGLRGFFAALKDYDPWTVAVLMHTPAPELNELTPLDWVRRGLELDVLGDYAGRVAAEWAR